MSERIAKPRPSPRAKRPPPSALAVEPIAAVITGWRVFGLVTPTAIAISRVVTVAAPDSTAASFTSCRSEIQAEPRPRRSASASSSSIGRGSETRPGSV